MEKHSDLKMVPLEVAHDASWRADLIMAWMASREGLFDCH
jgi:hypothetical protein